VSTIPSFDRMSRRLALQRGMTFAAGMGMASAMGLGGPAVSPRRAHAQATPNLLLGSHMAPIIQLVDEYNAATGSAVAYEQITTPDLQNKLQTSFLARQSPWDATFLTAALVASLADQEWLDDVDAFINEKVRNGGQGQFLENGMGAGIYQGKAYGVPWTMGAPMLHWNKQLMEQFDLDPEAPATWHETPNSWQTAIEYAIAMTGEVDGQPVYGFTDAWAGDHILWTWGGLLQAHGGSFLDADLLPVMNSEAGIAATQIMYDMLHTHKCIDPAVLTYTWVFDASPGYFEGRRGMFITWPFIAGVANAPEGSAVAGHSGYAPNPSVETSASVDGSEFFGIPVYAEQKEEALAFLEYLVSTDAQRVIAMNGWAGIYGDVITEPEILETFPFYEAISKQYEYPVDGGWSPDRTTWTQILTNELQEIMAQKKSPKDGLDDAVKKIQDSRS
jgi:multiple sugar transport system substrate-binding protein